MASRTQKSKPGALLVDAFIAPHHTLVPTCPACCAAVTAPARDRHRPGSSSHSQRVPKLTDHQTPTRLPRPRLIGRESMCIFWCVFFVQLPTDTEEWPSVGHRSRPPPRDSAPSCPRGHIRLSPSLLANDICPLPVASVLGLASSAADNQMP